MSNNIEALSDFEINKRVAFWRGLQVQEIDDSKVTGMNTRYHELCPDTVWVSNGNEPWYQFCPTHCGADAWPIIAEYEINILFNWNEDGLHGATSGFPGLDFENSNALRAAMCVFLSKHEAGND